MKSKVSKEISDLKEEVGRIFGAIAGTLLWNVLPWMLLGGIWSLLDTDIITALRDSYRSDPDGTITGVVQTVLILIILKSTISGLRFRLGNRVEKVDPFLLSSTGYAVLSKQEDDLPMPAERQTLNETYPSDITEAVIAISDPGDSMETLKERADKFMALVEDKLELPGVAQHEAAHAIAAKACGAVVLVAKVIDGERPRGSVEFVSGIGMSRQDDEWSKLVITLAGWSMDQSQLRKNTGSMDDLSSVSLITQKIISLGINPTMYGGALRYDDMIAAARSQAIEIIASNKATVDTLVAELLDKRTLNSHQLRDILKNVQSPNQALAA